MGQAPRQVRDGDDALRRLRAFWMQVRDGDIAPRRLWALWVPALVLALYLAYETGGLDDLLAADAVGRQVEETLWAVPLAAAAALTVFVSSRVRRRWPQRFDLVALIVFVGLYGLITAAGLLRALLILGLLGFVGLMATWLLVLPRRLAPPLPAKMVETLGDRDRIELTDARLKLQNDLRATALQAVAGLAVLAGAVFAFQQLTDDRQQANATRELTLQGQASERFTNAVDQLGSDLPEVQLGGIYGLEQIARQAPDNRLAVTEVLVAYLQRRARPEPTTQPPQPPQELQLRAPELQAAVTVLLRRSAMLGDPPLNLSGLDLSGGTFSGEFYTAADGLHLKAANLVVANLSGSDLRGATFTSVFLDGADFTGADLRGADFQNASAAGADDLPGWSNNPPEPGIKRAKFVNARADGSTKWEPGFDWRAAGVKLT
jgi:hypothetical protein